MSSSLDASALRAQVARNQIARQPSSVLLKTVMAVTGFVWFGFLIGHLGTNAHLFGGPSSLNAYYAGLKANALLFWGVRVVLATSVLAHVVAAVALMRRNAAARPIAYHQRRNQTSTLASRTMRWSGPLIGLFIVYHLLHLTQGSAMPPGTTFIEGDDYANIVSSFSVAYVAAIYVLSIALVGLHVWHGAWAATLSLGVRHPRYARPLRLALGGAALALMLGMLSLPLSVLAGWVQ